MWQRKGASSRNLRLAFMYIKVMLPMEFSCFSCLGRNSSFTFHCSTSVYLEWNWWSNLQSFEKLSLGMIIPSRSWNRSSTFSYAMMICKTHLGSLKFCKFFTNMKLNVGTLQKTGWIMALVPFTAHFQIYMASCLSETICVQQILSCLTILTEYVIPWLLLYLQCVLFICSNYFLLALFH